MSDQLAVMNEGRVEQVGTPKIFIYAPDPVCGWVPGRGELDRRYRHFVRSTRIGRQAENHGAKSFPALVTDYVFLGDCFQVIVRMASAKKL